MGQFMSGFEQLDQKQFGVGATDGTIECLIQHLQTPSSTGRTPTLFSRASAKELRLIFRRTAWAIEIQPVGAHVTGEIQNAPQESAPSLAIVLDGCLGSIQRNDLNVASEVCYANLHPQFSTIGELGWFMEDPSLQSSNGDDIDHPRIESAYSRLAEVFVVSSQARLLRIPYTEFDVATRLVPRLTRNAGLVVTKKLRKQFFIRQQLSVLQPRRRVVATLLRIASRHLSAVEYLEGLSASLHPMQSFRVHVPLCITREFLKAVANIKEFSNPANVMGFVRFASGGGYAPNGKSDGLSFDTSLIPREICECLEKRASDVPWRNQTRAEWQFVLRAAAWSMGPKALCPPKELPLIEGLFAGVANEKIWEERLEDWGPGRPRRAVVHSTRPARTSKNPGDRAADD